MLAMHLRSLVLKRCEGGGGIQWVARSPAAVFVLVYDTQRALDTAANVLARICVVLM